MRTSKLEYGSTTISIMRADTFGLRLRGLLARGLGSNEGLLLDPCGSVHTCFMSYPIDVAYLDDDDKVICVDESMEPWRLGRTHRGCRRVLELSAGRCGELGICAGAQLEIGR